MPVTTRISASLDRPYEDQNPSSPPPFTAHDIGSASGAHSTPNGSLSSYSRTNSVDSLDSSGSSSASGGSCSIGSSTNGHSRQVSNDSTTGDFIPTRSIKQASKPQHNPLQFVKVGTCPLYKKAEQQIKKAEEVKKMTTVKQEAEEWQHNLDDWKNKRRQSSHKLVERAEELKKLEAVEHDRKRRKSKTFNEMMEERSKRGVGLGMRKLSYPLDWDENDMNNKFNGHTDNGSPKLDLSLDSTGSDQVFQDDSSISETSSIDKNMDNDLSSQDEPKNNNNLHENGVNGNLDTDNKVPENGCETIVPSSANTEEYTFDKAIQSYVQYAEAQKKSGSRDKKVANGDSQPLSSSRWKSDVVDGKKNGMTNGKSYIPKVEKIAKVDPKVERSGGRDMSIVVTIKPGAEPRDFGFTTKGQGHGMVFVEHLVPRGAAEAAGLKVNDEILSINGEGASNRSHSAIVFAIKQAVYTGWLELHVYRYDNATETPSFNPSQTVVSPTNHKVSRVEERKAAFCKERSFEKEVSPEKRPFVREQSPKVDVVKRRSLFESPSRDNADIQINRRSLDASNALKNRIASFESLDAIDKHERKSITPDRSTTPDRSISAVKDRLQSYETKDSSDRVSEKKPVKSCRSDFRKRLASFESDKPSETKIPVATERKQSLKEKIATFEKVEPFERSQSCDLLDSVVTGDRYPTREKNVSKRVSPMPTPEDTVDSPSLHNWVDEPVVCEEDSGPPRIINLVTKEDSPEPQMETPKSPEKPSEMPQEVLSRTMSPVDPVIDEKPEELEHPVASPDMCEQPIVEEFVQKTLKPSAHLPKEQTVPSNNEVPNLLEETSVTEAEPLHQQPSVQEDQAPKTNGVLSPESDSETDRMEQQILHQLEQAEQRKPLPSSTPLEVAFDLLELTNMGEEVIIIDDFDFDSPPRMVEPPKEKPPPPPVDVDSSNEQSPDSTSSKLKRVESTKRIRKEIYKRRTDFLGIEPSDERNYVEIDMNSPPTLESTLRTDRPSEHQVEYSNMNGHDSIPSEGTNTSSLNGIHSPRLHDDDDIARKEREIIEDLEREEQLKRERYKHTNGVLTAAGDDDGRVRRLEEERRQMEQERHFREEERIRLEEEKKLREREEQLRCQETPSSIDACPSQIPCEIPQQELLRLEREKLRQEQEDLMRQREEYQRQIQQHQQIYTSPKPPATRTPNPAPPLQQMNGDFEPVVSPQDPIPAPRMSKMDPKPVNNNQKLPVCSPEARRRDEVIKREEVIKSSRRPGVANKAKPVEKNSPPCDDSQILENGPQVMGNGPQPMSKHTLYALSASPKAKLTEGERWMAKRKPDAPKRDPAAYNQHWLIQEAEMRRINDHQNRLRQAKSPTREASPPENPAQNYHQQHQPQPQQRRHPPPPNFAPPRLNLGDKSAMLDNSRSTVPSPSSREQNATVRSPHDRRDYVELPAPAPPPKNHSPQSPVSPTSNGDSQMLSVSGKKKCSHCGEELGRGAAMIIESLQLFYHIHCFKCCVCHVQLGNGLSGADVRVRSQKLHCHNCYSNDEAGLKFSKV